MPVHLTDTAREAAAAAQLRPIDTEEMMSSPPIEVTWLVDNMIPASHCTILHGAGGVGKSMLALAISVAVATGRDLLGRSVAQGPVIYVDAENGEHLMRQRLGWLDAPVDIDLIVLGAEGADLLRSNAELTTIIEEQRPRLVVCDSLASLWSVDENSASEITWALGPIIAATHAVEATLIVLHHDRKDGTTYRGSSALQAITGSLVQMHTPRSEDPDAKMLELRKTRFTRPGIKKWIRMTCDTGEVALSDIDAPETSTKKALKAQILGLLDDGNVWTNAAISTALGRSRSDGSVNRTVQELLEDGSVMRLDGKGGVQLPKVAA